MSREIVRLRAKLAEAERERDEAVQFNAEGVRIREQITATLHRADAAHADTHRILGEQRARAEAAEARVAALEAGIRAHEDAEYDCGMYANVGSPKYADLIESRKRLRALLGRPSKAIPGVADIEEVMAYQQCPVLAPAEPEQPKCGTCGGSGRVYGRHDTVGKPCTACPAHAMKDGGA